MTARLAHGRHSARSPAGRVRAGSAPAQADGSSRVAAATEPAGTGPYPAATARRAPDRLAVQRRAGRCCPERPVQARVERVPRERPRAAGREPSGKARGGADRHQRVLPMHWAVPAARSAGLAKPGARSAPGPDAAARSVRSKAHAAPLAVRMARSGRAPRQRAVPDGAAARARPGWPEARPVAQTVGAGRSGALRPDARGRRGGRQVAGPERGERRDVPDHRERGAPGRPAAGGAGPAGRHRRIAPAQAGAMERRNCPATTRWRG